MINTFNKYFPVVEKAVDEFPWGEKSSYCQFLAQTYYYVSHSTRMLAVAAGQLNLEDEFLHHRLLDHAREEKSHQLLAKHDLEQLGQVIASFPELPTTNAFYEPQFYKILYKDSTALFGYIIMLEGLAVRKGAAIYRTAAAAFGDKAATFLKVHAEEDVDHLEKAFKYVAKFSDKQIELVGQNLQQSCSSYALFLEGIKHSHFKAKAA